VKLAFEQEPLLVGLEGFDLSEVRCLSKTARPNHLKREDVLDALGAEALAYSFVVVSLFYPLFTSRHMMPSWTGNLYNRFRLATWWTQ
jgi:hypothetical protein